MLIAPSSVFLVRCAVAEDHKPWFEYSGFDEE